MKWLELEKGDIKQDGDIFVCEAKFNVIKDNLYSELEKFFNSDDYRQANTTSPMGRTCEAGREYSTLNIRSGFHYFRPIVVNSYPDSTIDRRLELIL